MRMRVLCVRLYNRDRLRMLERLPMVLVFIEHELLPGTRLALDHSGVGRDDERVLFLGWVEELAVTAEASGFGTLCAAMPFVEPDNDTDDPGDADDAYDVHDIDWVDSDVSFRDGVQV